MSRAVVLAGGGARGAWSAGVLRELDRHYEHLDDPIRIVSGTSVGALIGAGYVANGAESVAELWYRLRERDVFRRPRIPLWRAVQVLRGRAPALFDTRPLKRLIRYELDPSRLRHSSKTLLVHAYHEGDERLLVTFDGRDPEILRAVYASAAIPFTFPSLRAAGVDLVDGLVVSNVPLRTVIEAGARRVTVVIPDHRDPPRRVRAAELRNRVLSTPSPVSPLSRAAELLDAALDAQWSRDLEGAEIVNQLVRSIGGKHPKYREVRIQVVRPSCALGSPLDFGAGPVKVRMGEADARRAILANP